MSDPIDPAFDMREFCARILQEYEDVIARIIQRPVPVVGEGPGPGIGTLAVEGALPSEPA